MTVIGIDNFRAPAERCVCGCSILEHQPGAGMQCGNLWCTCTQFKNANWAAEEPRDVTPAQTPPSGMSDEAIGRALNAALDILHSISWTETAERCEWAGSPLLITNSQRRQHLRWMIEETRSLLQQGKREKAFRWLGFIQGTLWGMGVARISELKNANRHQDDSPRDAS